MNLSSNRVPENGSAEPTNAMPMQRKQYLNVFELMKIGMSSTLSVAIFIGIGYVVRHVAGPSAILSILIAAFIAYLVGKIEFQIELQTLFVFIIMWNLWHEFFIQTQFTIECLLFSTDVPLYI